MAFVDLNICVHCLVTFRKTDLELQNRVNTYLKTKENIPDNCKVDWSTYKIGKRGKTTLCISFAYVTPKIFRFSIFLPNYCCDYNFDD
jgi:hypothetical protein